MRAAGTAGRSGRAVTLVMPERADHLPGLAVDLGLTHNWEKTGYGLAAPRVGGKDGQRVGAERQRQLY